MPACFRAGIISFKDKGFIMNTKNKVINFLGDSITSGGGASCKENSYMSLLSKRAQLGKVNNYGEGGTRIAKQNVQRTEELNNEDFLTRAKRMDKDADFVFVFGGTNDYGHGDAPMGKLNNKDEYTFIGALQTLIEYLIEIYGKDKICCILPLPRYNAENVYGENGIKKEWGIEGYAFSEYLENERMIFEYYGVDYLDLSGLFYVPTTNKEEGLFCDGLHPNDDGHKIIANAIYEYLKNK